MNPELANFLATEFASIIIGGAIGMGSGLIAAGEARMQGKTNQEAFITIAKWTMIGATVGATAVPLIEIYSRLK